MREVALTWNQESIQKTDLAVLNDVVEKLTFVANLLITPEGDEIDGASSGLLAIKSAWPSTIRDVLGDYERFRSTYFPIDGFYLPGDGSP